ncbi:MAG: tetratricopeptide repeat protein [Burkholderiales bacterium]
MSSPADPFLPLLAEASGHLQAGRRQQAESIYRDLLARAPEHPVATHFLGVCLVQSGRAQEGLAALARSMHALGAQARFRHNYALMLAQAGDPTGAERELEAAIALDPRNAASHGYLGIVRQQAGRLEAASAAYEAGLAVAPADPFLAANYGSCLSRAARSSARSTGSGAQSRPRRTAWSRTTTSARR